MLSCYHLEHPLLYQYLPWKRIQKTADLASRFLTLNHRHLMASGKRPQLSRVAKAKVSYDAQIVWDPDVPSENLHVERIQVLNGQAYSHKNFALADDILMKVFMGSKLFNSKKWSGLTPELASTSPSARKFLSDIPDEVLLQLAKQCSGLTHPQSGDCLSTTVDHCMDIFLNCKMFQSLGVEWEQAMKQ